MGATFLPHSVFDDKNLMKTISTDDRFSYIRIRHFYIQRLQNIFYYIVLNFVYTSLSNCKLILDVTLIDGFLCYL